jgi:thiol-disulfide isomerase/thioredoxin
MRRLATLTLLLTTCCGAAVAGCLPQGFIPPNQVEGPTPQPLSARLLTLDGEETTLGAYRGQVVLVDFWASWCAPCRMAFPYYADIQHRRSSKGFVVVAISVDETLEDARVFSRRWGLPFEILHDGKKEGSAAFSVVQVPTSFLLDRHGRIRYIHRGFEPASAAKLEEEVMFLLGGG